MDLQYISDADGRQTAVVIPIEEWKSLTETYAGLKTLEPETHLVEKKPSDFLGILSKETALKMISDIEISRNEWDRNI